VGGQPFSLHAEGERVFLTAAGGQRREIDLTPPAADPVAPVPQVEAPGASRPGELPEPLCPQGVVAGHPGDAEEPAAPGASPLDAGLARLAEGARPPQEGGER
jgi:hypothetical protein